MARRCHADSPRHDGADTTVCAHLSLGQISAETLQRCPWCRVAIFEVDVRRTGVEVSEEHVVADYFPRLAKRCAVLDQIGPGDARPLVE